MRGDGKPPSGVAVTTTAYDNKSVVEAITERSLLWDHILKRVYVRFFRNDDRKKYNMELTKESNNNSNNDMIQYRQHLKIGSKCFTLTLKDDVTKHGIYYIKLVFLQYVEIVLHLKDQFSLGMESGGRGVRRGTRSENQVEYSSYINLPKGTDQKSATTCLTSSHDVCVDRNNGSINECPPPCKFYTINLGAQNLPSIKNKAEREYGLQYLYFPSFVQVNVELELYPFEAFAAEVGGYANLLLGFSILAVIVDSVEIIKERFRKMNNKNN